MFVVLNFAIISHFFTAAKNLALFVPQHSNWATTNPKDVNDRIVPYYCCTVLLSIEKEYNYYQTLLEIEKEIVSEGARGDKEF